MKRLSWLVLLALGCIALAGCRSRTVIVDDEFFAFTFEWCDFDRDCYYYPEDLCYTVYGDVADGMCTHTCSDDYDCLDEYGVCEYIDGPRLCYEYCEVHGDCARGFACFDINQGEYIVSVCLPA
jgi:hypothetical protein